MSIEVRGIDKVYRTGKQSVQALSDIELSIKEGEFITLFGPSGCGKSTLLRVIAGLEEHTGGTVEVFGLSPKESSRRKNIAWVPQSSALLPWANILDNTRLADTVNHSADRSGLSSRNPEDPHEMLGELGLADFEGARPSQLSGGMRQRAAIGRGFVQGAPLMLMDEPFSALDELTRDSLRLRLLEMWEQHRKTILFVTHSAFEAVMLSDRVVVMTPRPGRIRDVIDVDLPRPRTIELTETPEFDAKILEVKRTLRSGWDGE